MDVASASELAQRVGELLLDRGLALIELNPVFVSVSGAIVADAAVLEPVPSLCTT
jgi:succinyl-CoA synthetase beta subunit